MISMTSSIKTGMSNNSNFKVLCTHQIKIIKIIEASTILTEPQTIGLIAMKVLTKENLCRKIEVSSN